MDGVILEKINSLKLPKSQKLHQKMILETSMTINQILRQNNKHNQTIKIKKNLPKTILETLATTILNQKQNRNKKILTGGEISMKNRRKALKRNHN